MDNVKELRGLFINTIKENCSIHESGLMVFNILQLGSSEYLIDYIEMSEDKKLVSLNYDFYIFNYHHLKMGWLDTTCVQELPGKKFAIVLETSPNNPFVCVNKDDFDGYLVLDPTINLDNPKVFSFVRPLELEMKVRKHIEHDTPVIGSFGFPTPGKGFELIVDAVNKEFSKAIVRINVPPVNDDTSKHYYGLYNMDYSDYLENLCKSIAKPNIEVVFTRKYFNKDELINWCSENSLNCFMYNRFQTGLSATTDQAIVSGQPLAISSNETFRHLHQFIVPYPFRSLKDSIKYSSNEVALINEQWTGKVFRDTFLRLLKNTEVKKLDENVRTISLKHKVDVNYRHQIVNTGIEIIKEFVKRILNNKYFINNIQKVISDDFKLEIFEKRQCSENTILFVSHSSQKCGIHEFGWNIKEALKNSNLYHFCYVECKKAEEYYESLKQTNPSVIIYNYYPATMPWLSKAIIDGINVPQIGYVHEFDQNNIREKINQSFFKFNICPDPSIDLTGIENCFKTGRLLAKYQNYFNMPQIATIGSFGFGFPDKGFERIVETVQNEFEEAIININMPFNDIVDPDGSKFVLKTAARCRAVLTSDKIRLNITHNYLSKVEILNFLAINSVNVFLYNSEKTQGISSVLDYAISAQRPIAISSAKMFRHLRPYYDHISIDKNSLKSIISKGIGPIIPLLNDWSEPQFIMTYNKILDQVLGKNIQRTYAVVTNHISEM